jgi:hypothetical protein
MVRHGRYRPPRPRLASYSDSQPEQLSRQASRPKIFQIAFSDVSSVLCRRRDQLAVLTSNTTSVPRLFIVSTHLYREVRTSLWKSARVGSPTCCRYDGGGGKSGPYFISYGYGGFGKKSASRPLSKLPGYNLPGSHLAPTPYPQQG